MKRISDVVPPETVAADRRSLKDVEGDELVLTDFEWAEGDYGTYAILKVRDQRTDAEFEVATGAKPVVRQLEKLSPTDDLPILIRFVRQGRTWVMV